MSVDGTVFLRIHTTRVFVLRTWLGIRLMRLALWIMGSRAEAADG